MAQNLPFNAGDMGSVPDLGRSPMLWNSEAHVSQLLSLCSRAQETQLLKPAHPRAMLCNKRSHCNKKPVDPYKRIAHAHCNWRKAHTALKTQYSQK